MRNAPRFNRTMHEYISSSEPEISTFSAQEISLVDDIIYHICHSHMATSISEASPTRIWELSTIGEEIPYSAIFADGDMGDIDELDIQWALEVIKKAA